MSGRTTRVVPTGPSNGYGSTGKHLAQYFDRDMKVWFDIGDPHDTEAEALAAAQAYADDPNPTGLDYLVDDFDDGSSGYYRVWYRRTTPPAGPFWNVAAMAKQLGMADYPDDGYVVWYQEGQGPSNVPSLNPDDLVKP